MAKFGPSGSLGLGIHVPSGGTSQASRRLIDAQTISCKPKCNVVSSQHCLVPVLRTVDYDAAPLVLPASPEVWCSSICQTCNLHTSTVSRQYHLWLLITSNLLVTFTDPSLHSSRWQKVTKAISINFKLCYNHRAQAAADQPWYSMHVHVTALQRATPERGPGSISKTFTLRCCQSRHENIIPAGLGA